MASFNPIMNLKKDTREIINEETTSDWMTPVKS